MKKTQGQKDLELAIKEALRTGRENLLRTSTRAMYKYLSFQQKQNVIKNMEEGANPADVYGKELADSILRKQSKLINDGERALKKADTYEEEKAIRSKMKISSADIAHLKNNIETVKSSEDRSIEVSMKAFMKSDAYYSYLKDYYGKPQFRSAKEIYASFKRRQDEKEKETPFGYKGGSRKEGYTFRTRKNAKGEAFEIQTPGYDEVMGVLHGFRYRKVGDIEWISASPRKRG